MIFTVYMIYRYLSLQRIKHTRNKCLCTFHLVNNQYLRDYMITFPSKIRRTVNLGGLFIPSTPGRKRKSALGQRNLYFLRGFYCSITLREFYYNTLLKEIFFPGHLVLEYLIWDNILNL